MKGPRTDGTGILRGENGFAYACEWDWVKWPEELKGIHTLNGAFLENRNLITATDDKNAPLIEITPDGELVRIFGQGLFDKAHSVTITPEHTILSADTGMHAHIIQELTMGGELIRTFGTYVVCSDSGYDPKYLEVLKARNEVPDDPSWNKRPDFNARLDSIKRAGRPFGRPCAMKKDSQGRYYAADGYANAAVHRFSAEGVLEKTWGAPGKGPGQFRIVHDIYIDPEDRLWIADRENACIHVYDTEGNLLVYIDEGLFKVGGIWGDGELVYVGEMSGGFTIMDLEFRRIAQFGAPGSPLHAHGISCDKDGNVYLFTNKRSPVNNIVRLRRI